MTFPYPVRLLYFNILVGFFEICALVAECYKKYEAQ